MITLNERCKHFVPPQPTATQGTATIGPFICPWCEIERLKVDLELLARSGCSVREYNGRRFVEIASDTQL